MKFIPKHKDRFKVYIITRTERPSHHDKYRCLQVIKYFGHLARLCTNCRKAMTMGDELVFEDDLGIGRSFLMTDIVCEKIN